MMDRPEKSIPNKSVKRIVPNARDVVLGRGKIIDSLRGNATFRGLIGKHRSSYETAHRHFKHRIAEMIMGQVIDSGGRFLKANDKHNKDSGFCVISMRQALEKIKQALREKQRNRLPAARPRECVVPPKKHVTPKGIANIVVEVDVEAAVQLLHLKKEAEPIDLYLHEAIKVLDTDDPDDDDLVTTTVSSRYIVPTVTTTDQCDFCILMQDTERYEPAQICQKIVPGIHCPIVCSMCCLAFFPLVASMTPLPVPVSSSSDPWTVPSSVQLPQ
jgi:hypothetical protein